jgi:exonuclease VII small subunit
MALYNGNLILLEQFFRKRISGVYRSCNRYWSKQVAELKKTVDDFEKETLSLKESISNLEKDNLTLKESVKHQEKVNLLLKTQLESEKTPKPKPINLNIKEPEKPNLKRKEPPPNIKKDPINLPPRSQDPCPKTTQSPLEKLSNLTTPIPFRETKTQKNPFIKPPCLTNPAATGIGTKSTKPVIDPALNLLNLAYFRDIDPTGSTSKRIKSLVPESTFANILNDIRLENNSSSSPLTPSLLRKIISRHSGPTEPKIFQELYEPFRSWADYHWENLKNL